MRLRREKMVSVPAEKRSTAEAAVRRKKTVKRAFYSAARILLLAFAVSLLVCSFLFPLMLISGDSMEPGLNNGDLILLSKTHKLTAGDLVSFHWNDKTLLKRIIACAGDWVMIDKSGRVYVNGILLNEPYVSEFSFGESDVSYPLQVPENSYFVMGDERVSSLDSRSSLVGCVHDDQVIGKGMVRIWKNPRTEKPR